MMEEATLDAKDTIAVSCLKATGGKKFRTNLVRAGAKRIGLVSRRGAEGVGSIVGLVARTLPLDAIDWSHDGLFSPGISFILGV